MLTPERVIELLELEELPFEGGYFRETYRAEAEIGAGALPFASERARNCSTQIYYLLTREQTSSLHVVRSDEVFHHYMGDPVTQLVVDGDRAEVVTLGFDLERGWKPQHVVTAGVWQGAELGEGDAGFALLGATVSPGFDWEDFALVTTEQAAEMSGRFPEHAGLIGRLTPVEGRTRA
ncbi:MAG: cupin domain-containing protein [Planctomycetota bacterium]